MKIIPLLILAIFITGSYGRVHVKGYYKKNGTYVAPHYRSDPDGILSNNYSYPGNINPNKSLNPSYENIPVPKRLPSAFTHTEESTQQKEERSFIATEIIKSEDGIDRFSVVKRVEGRDYSGPVTYFFVKNLSTEVSFKFQVTYYNSLDEVVEVHKRTVIHLKPFEIEDFTFYTNSKEIKYCSIEFLPAF